MSLMDSEESFTANGLRKDIESMIKISDAWREKMRFLPADQEFALLRRAVVHVEKAAKLIDRVVEKYVPEDEPED